MIEHLRVDPAALAPRRDHVHRNARTETPRARGAGDDIPLVDVLARGRGNRRRRDPAASSASEPSASYEGVAPAARIERYPSFSSNVRNSTVLAHTSGFDVSAVDHASGVFQRPAAGSRAADAQTTASAAAPTRPAAARRSSRRPRAGRATSGHAVLSTSPNPVRIPEALEREAAVHGACPVVVRVLVDAP